LRPAAFFCTVVPRWLEDERDELECDFDIPFSFRASYCFSFLTFARLLGMSALLGRVSTRPIPLLVATKQPSNRATLLTMESRGDSWESTGWDAAWQQPEEKADRDEVLQLARRLAEARQRQSAEALVQVEDLKRVLRERAADVARRELEVEQRTKKLDDEEARAHEGRRLRLRRPERDADRAYAEELLARREAELQQRLDALAPRERETAERETALRARELEVEESETTLKAHEQELAESKASLDRRKEELEGSYGRLPEQEATFAAREAELADQRRSLESSLSEAARATDELVERAATVDAAEQELAAERVRLDELARELEAQADAARTAEERSTGEQELRFAEQARALEERARAVDELERQLTIREREAAAAEQRSAAEGERKLVELDSQLAARESDLAAREAELLKVQAGLAAQQESIRRRERALDDAERLQERERALPAVPYVSFSDGLDAFTAGRPRSG
jgi:hypothetical protein